MASIDGRRPRGTAHLVDAAPLVLIAAVFLSAYLSWRPLRDVMVTVSDGLFLVAALVLIQRRRIPWQPLGALTAYWQAAFGVMMVGLLIGSVFDDDPIRWLIVAMQYGFAWIVLPFVLMGHDRAYNLTLAKSLLWGLVVMEAVGALVYFSYRGSFESARALLGLDFISGNRRLGAFATDANWNGAAVSMALPFAYYLAAKGVLRPLPALVAVGILVLGAVLSASFTAFISIVVATAIFAAVGAVRPRFSVVFGVVVAAALVVQSGYGLPATFQKRVAGAVESGDMSQAGTYEGRLALIEDAWNMVGDHMLVGVGVDQFRVVSKLRAPVHNMYLLVWVEGGMLALIGWLGMMAVLVAGAVAGYRRDRLATALALSVLSTFLTFSTASPHMYARLWAVPVLIALAIALETARVGSPRLPWPRRDTPAQRRVTA